MCVTQWGRALAVVFAFGAATAATVTTPVGVYTNSSPSNSGDSLAPNTWLRTNVRSGGEAGINTAYPRNGNASAYLSLGANTNNDGKADWEYYPSATFGRLADLGTLSYDWYRDAASTVPVHLHPLIRLYIDADGNTSTTNDRGYLVYERCYNVPSCPAVATNTWTSESITNSTNLWWVQPSVGTDTVYNRTLAQYKAGSYTPTTGFAQINGSSLILGVSLGIGSGWNSSASPAFKGAIDNVTVQSTTAGAAQITADNFELVQTATTANAVPALSNPLLLALAGLLALMVYRVAGRRRHG